jgi:hypothetical protein
LKRRPALNIVHIQTHKSYFSGIFLAEGDYFWFDLLAHVAPIGMEPDQRGLSRLSG